MELVPIIWQTLLYGTIVLSTVLVVSFVLSKLRKKDPVAVDFQLIPDRPLYPAGRLSTQNIQITSSRHEREQMFENQPKIYNIQNSKPVRITEPTLENPHRGRTDEYRKDLRPTSTSAGGGSRNQRYTIINEQINHDQFPLRKSQTGEYYRFSNTVFYY